MKLKIWHKMIIGISIPSLIALLGGVLTYGYINDVKNRQGLVQVVDDLKEHVLEIRRNEKSFLDYKNDERYRVLKYAVSDFSVSFGKVPPKTIKEIGAKEASGLSEHLNKYSLLADNLSKSFRQEKEIEKGKLSREKGSPPAILRYAPSKSPLPFNAM